MFMFDPAMFTSSLENTTFGEKSAGRQEIESNENPFFPSKECLRATSGVNQSESP